MWPSPRRPRRSFAAAAGTLAVLAAAAVAPGPVAAAAGPAAAAEAGCSPGLGVGLVDTPDSLKDPRAAVYVVAELKPGQSVTRRFQVCNGTAAPVTVKLYGGDATVGGGAFTVTEGRTTGDVASWTTVTPSTVTVQPQQRVVATATIRVPSTASEGERYGVLLAELPPRPGSGSVGVASRVGVRVYLGVGPGGAPRSDFDVESLQASRGPDGIPVVTARVRNTGARALDMRGSLTLTEGPGGLSSRPYPATVGTTLGIGEVAPVSVVLDKAISGGPWLATLTMLSGTLERKERARILFPDVVGTSTPPVVSEDVPLAKDRSVVIPVAAGFIGLLLLLLLILALLTSRRRKADKTAVPADGAGA